MNQSICDRRSFLQGIASGALVLGGAGGPVFGMNPERMFAGLPREHEPLDFGALEPLAAWMQETEADDLIAGVVARLRQGTEPRTLVAAAALANARTFGGEDYVGYHAAMALMPAFEMSAQMPAGREALPIIKVLHRNTKRMRERGGRTREVLHRLDESATDGRSLVELGRAGALAAAEREVVRAVATDRAAAYAALQPMMRDNIDVHQVVLTWRAWDLQQLTGAEHAATMLRQCVHEYVQREQDRANRGRRPPSLRQVLPQLLERHHLLDRASIGRRQAETSFVAQLADTILRSSPDAAAEAAAAALAEGFAPDVVGEALSRASLRLLLGDPGLREAQPGKPVGSVHGASVGVHACDSADAWRNIAAVVDPANAIASMIAGAWHTGGQLQRSSDRPTHGSARDDVARIEVGDLAAELGQSIAQRDQPRAAAIGERWLTAGLAAQDAFALLLEEAVANDGALHHEKFFRTCFEGFHRSPSEFRPDWLAALARVAASGHGFEAPGHRAAVELLG